MAFGFATSSRSDAVNKDITGNDIPDEVTAVGETLGKGAFMPKYSS